MKSQIRIADATVALSGDTCRVMSSDTQLFHYVSHRNNMMVVRYYLSLCVLLAHASVLTGYDFPWLQRGTVDVGCFFAISGFLMFPSYQKRRSFKHYIRRRALRILPSYFFIILLCAIGLVAVSTLPAADYFTSPGFWKYLGANISTLNFLQPDLPGVFTGSQFHTSAVNGSLWTMKGEWVCYLSVPLVFWMVMRHKHLSGLIMASVLILAIAMRCIFSSLASSIGAEIYSIIARQFGTLLVFFYVGALINRYYTCFLRYRWWILAADILILLLGTSLPFYSELFQPVMAGSLIIWVSMIGSWGTFLSRFDSISYDIYLYHFPVIQLAICLGLDSFMPPAAMLAVIVIFTVALAFTSWRLIGRHFNNMYR